MNTRKVLILASIFAVLIVLTPPVLAQQPESWISYSAKFVCGRQDPGGETTVGGRYRTVVNIHNPHYLTGDYLTGGNTMAGIVPALPAPLIFFKKAVLALPQGNPQTPPSCFQQEFLRADHSLAVTCRNIKSLFNLSGIPVGRPFEGYLVILVPPLQANETPAAPEPDVTAVYTASQRLEDDGVQTMEIEEVKPKDVIGNPAINQCNGAGKREQ